MNWRINLIWLFLFLFGLAIVGRLFFIQIIQGDFYKALARGLYGGDIEEQEERGEIFLKDGESLAINLDWPLIFSSPGEIEDKEETAEKVALVLNLDKGFVLEKLQKDTLYEVIKKKVNQEETEKIEELNLKGIYPGKESGRYYPQESFASQLAGFLDANGNGQYGLEESFNEILAGERGTPGSNLILTIDYSIQFMAEKLLEKAKENLNIEEGSIVVINPNSGEILALANFPNFNPNQYSRVTDFNVFQNSLTQKIFEPGSVFKPITMAAAINEGKITPQTTYLDPGVVEFDGWPIYNYEQRVYRGEETAEITMTEVLEKSVNTGAVFAEQQLGRELFFEYIEKFGIFEPTGIDLRETVPENKEFHEGLEMGREINFATASFGQGIEMSPIQLLRAYCAIANGGKLIKPYLVKEIQAGEEVMETEPEAKDGLIISQKTASQIVAMLVNVVENGFAKSAQIPGYYVAGKTGTAQISWSALEIDEEGYSDKTWQTFIGFAPAFSPQFAILIKLDNPETKTAEYSAVPIFHDLAKHIIDYYQIPPDYQ
jgi:cell division protein FtsI/penicillin-binding protein 2